MTKAILKLAAILTMCITAFAQVPPVTPPLARTTEGNFAGLLYASNFGQWQVPKGNLGPYSWNQASFCYANVVGVTFQAFTVGTPITIVDTGNPSATEIVTPTVVTIVPASGSSMGTCSITVAPVNPHTNFYFASATEGLQEALNWASTSVYTIILTPDWTRLGGNDTTITTVSGNSNVTIFDQRTSNVQTCTWGGSAYSCASFGGGAISPEPQFLLPCYTTAGTHTTVGNCGNNPTVDAAGDLAVATKVTVPAVVSGAIPTWNILNYATPLSNPQSSPNPYPQASRVTDGTVTQGSASISAPDANFTGTAGQLVTVLYCPSSGSVSCQILNITSWACTGTTCTFQAPNTLASGNTVLLYKFQTTTNFNGQTVTVLSSGLSTTQFEAVVSGATTGSATESGNANNLTTGVADFEGTIISGSGTTATVSANLGFGLTGTATILWGPDIGIALNAQQVAACTSWRFNGQRYAPTFYIPTGFYLMATPVEWICGNYKGEGNPQFSSTIYWTPTASTVGTVPFFKNVSGDSGIWSMEMMSLATPSRNSVYPTTWLKISTSVDETTLFQNNHISNFSASGLWLAAGGIVNFHPYHNRWDDAGGPVYLYTIPNPGGQNQGSVSQTMDTVDMGTGNGTQLGTVCPNSYVEIDNTVNSGNPLTFSWTGAQRIESECQLPGSNRFAIIQQDGAGTNTINYHISDLTIQESKNTNPYNLFYLNGSSSIANFGSQVELENLKFDPNLTNFVNSTSGGSQPIESQCQVVSNYISTCFPPITTFYNQSNLVTDSDFKWAGTFWPTVNAAYSFVQGGGADLGNAWSYTGTGTSSGSLFIGTCTTVGTCTITIPNNATVTLSAAIMGANVTSSGQPYAALVPSIGGTPYCQAFNNGIGLNSGYLQNGLATSRAKCTYTNSTGSTVNPLVEFGSGNSTVSNGNLLEFSNPQVENGFTATAYKENDFPRGTSTSTTLPSTILPSPSACATCVVATSPGVGIAHFAGSTQTVTSSAVSLTADVSGNLPNANLASQTANTVLGALTATTPSGLAVPSCSTTSCALGWLTGTGFQANTVAQAGSNSNITQLTGLTTALSPSQGGTGHTTLTQYCVLIGAGTGAITVTTCPTNTGAVLITNGSSANPSFGQLNLASTNAVTGVLPVANLGSSIATAPTGAPTYTAGTNVTSCAQASGYTNTNTRGELTIVGGTATTGTICTVNFSTTLGTAPGMCTVTQNGGAVLFSVGHGTPGTTGFTVTAGISVVSATATVDYVCMP